MSNYFVRLLVLVLFMAQGLVGCKPRRESDVKTIGYVDITKGAVPGSGRNSFYGKPEGKCLYSRMGGADLKISKFINEETGDLSDDYEAELKKFCAGDKYEQFRFVCLESANPEAKSVQGYIKIVDNLSQLASTIDLDVSTRLSLNAEVLSFNLSDFSLSAAAKQIRSIDKSDRKIYFVAYAKVSGKSLTVVNPTIRPYYLADLLELAPKTNTGKTPVNKEIKEAMADFLDTCGDEFSETLNYGQEFIGIMEAELKSGVSKSQVFASITANGTLSEGVFNAGGKFEAKNDRLEGVRDSFTNISIYFSQNGGEISTIVVPTQMSVDEGYQKLLCSLQNFLNPGACPKNGESKEYAKDFPEPLDPRPKGTIPSSESPATGSTDSPTTETPPVENDSPAPDSQAQAGLTGFNLSESKTVSQIISADFTNYAEIPAVRKLLRKFTLPDAGPNDPQNLAEYHETKKAELIAYLAKFEKINENNTISQSIFNTRRAELTKSQINYINRYQELLNRWVATMKMDPSSNCRMLGSRCKIPVESDELKKIMNADPKIDLTDFKLPLPLPEENAELSKQKQKIENGDWRFGLNRNVLTRFAYLDGMRYCPAGWRFPHKEEFDRLVSLGLLQTAEKYYPPNKDSKKVSRDDAADNRFISKCFWRRDSRYDTGKKDAPLFPAWWTEPKNGGEHSFLAPTAMQCFAVCIDGKIKEPIKK